MPSYALPLVAVLLVVLAQVNLKTGVAAGLEGRRGSSPVGALLRLVASPRIVLGLSLYACSSALWIYVLARTPLSYAYPFLGLSYVGVALAATIFLGERLAPAQWAGLSLVVLGVAAVGFSM